MAAITTVIAAIAATAAVAGTAMSIAGQASARDAANKSREQQEAAQNEQRAANAQAAAEDRRKQVREERVRRARIVQASINGGSQFSSGEEGALGVLSTNLNTGIGASAGGEQRANSIGGYLQGAANANAGVQRGQNMASLGNQIYGLGSSLFGASQKMGTIFGTEDTASRYNTIAGSQQTQMLAAQDKGLF